jgi:hypothetical protein
MPQDEPRQAMTDTHHPKIAEFLDKERRQVWAVHRDTGEPFYLPEGQAETLRPYTQASLRCPYTTCEMPINTRGGSRRATFYHLKSPPHEDSRESEFHLAAKAMLAQWAGPRIPEGASVQEEQTVKDPPTRLLRRADVMVTGQSGRRVAYEVEYKAFAVDDWRRKQADYDTEKIPCTWLIGHTRISLARGPKNLPGLGETAVRVKDLATAIAADGHPLLVVNPVTRQVGTLAADPDFTKPYRGEGTLAWVAVEDLDDCDFEPRRGIVTPTMRRIDEHEAERQRKAAEQAERTRRYEEVRRARVEAEEARLRALWAAWEASPVFKAFQDRWGGAPPEIAVGVMVEPIRAVPVHWHGVLYEELVHGRAAGFDFKWRDVFRALDHHRIARSTRKYDVYRALDAYFEHLQRVGVIRIHRDPRRAVLMFSCTGLTLEQTRVEAARQREAERQRLERYERAAQSAREQRRRRFGSAQGQ